MILRRITQHVKDQNWFAVALDFVIVVMGILIAFQITNWNEARGERHREVQILREIGTDLQQDIFEYSRTLSYCLDKISALDRFC